MVEFAGIVEEAVGPAGVVDEPIGPAGVAEELIGSELVAVSGQTVVETGTTTVTVVGWAVKGQLVMLSGHWEMVSTVVE